MPKGPVADIARGAIHVYKNTLSPVFYLFGARCRHEPTCSDYALEAFRRHNPWTAFWLTLSRLSRCHPIGSHGFDPPPSEPPDAAWWQVWKLGDWSWRERGGEGHMNCDKHTTTDA